MFLKKTCLYSLKAEANNIKNLCTLFYAKGFAYHSIFVISNNKEVGCVEL